MKNQIAWMIDPFTDDPRLTQRGAALTQALSKASGLAIEPTYIVTPTELRISFPMDAGETKRMKAFATEKCRQSIAARAWPSLMPPRVIYGSQPGFSSGAAAASRHALRAGTELIVAATHSHGGTGLAGLGSFTNALLAKSKVPVLSVRGAAKANGAPKRILFATDFSPASTKAFIRLCSLARRTGSEVLICHVFFRPVAWYAPELAYTLSPNDWEKDLVESALRDGQQRGQRLLALAKRRQVKAKFRILEAVDGVAPTVIRAARRERADWIALAGEGGTIGQRILGTTAQKLVHTSPIPVWVHKTV
jgi:nucleotide-binding universal stress UspA family protein